MAGQEFVAYFRVSTARQGQSGLGIEAQRTAVYSHVQAATGTLAGEFVECESGTRRNRPQLTLALDLCRKRRAILVIAKLDRLARNVAFVSSLLESRVRFVATDMPEADIAFLQMAAVFGEWEARKISERTKAALAAAKARGACLGWANPDRAPHQRSAARRGADANRTGAIEFARNILPIVESIRGAGINTLDGIASALNARGILTARGGSWHASTVSRLQAYAQ